MTTNTYETRSSEQACRPAGLWRMMLRLHRDAVLIVLAVGAALTVFAIVVRSRLTADPALWDCYILTQGDVSTCDTLAEADWTAANILDNALWSASPTLAMTVLVFSILLGVAVGVIVFARDLESRTHTLALTQGVSRPQWWAAKVTVTGVPLILVLLGVGFLTQWALAPTLDSPNYFLSPLYIPVLGATSLVPAAAGFAAFGLSVAIGVMSRRVVIGLLLAAFTATVLFTGFSITYPHLVPTIRVTTPISEGQPGDFWGWSEGADFTARDYPYYLKVGTLNSAGEEQGVSDVCWGSADAAHDAVLEKYEGLADDDPLLEQAEDSWREALEAYNEVWAQCAAAEGITHHFRDSIEPDQATSLRLRLAAVLTAVGAAGLWLSRRALHGAVSRR